MNIYAIHNITAILRTAWTESLERTKESEMSLGPVKTTQGQRNNSLRQSWDFSPDHSPTKKHAPVNIEVRVHNVTIDHY